MAARWRICDPPVPHSAVRQAESTLADLRRYSSSKRLAGRRQPGNARGERGDASASSAEKSRSV